MTSLNIDPILTRIQQAAAQSGRSAEAITLVAVSKTKPVAAIRAAYEAGLRHFGENRADELEQKYHELGDLPDLHWHFIGRLQTRQSTPIAQRGDLFHAVDRLKIARRLSRQLTQFERTLPIFVQVNVSGEDSKAGFECSAWETDGQQREELLQAVESMLDLRGLDLRGLMTMAPWGISASEAHRIFARMRELSVWLNNHTSQPLPALSMGMSGDFEIAIEEGATHVRIGSAIFGERQYD